MAQILLYVFGKNLIFFSLSVHFNSELQDLVTDLPIDKKALVDLALFFTIVIVFGPRIS